MNLRDAIERAGNEQEIVFLLTTYVETVRQGDQLNVLPWQVRDLPLAGPDDLKGRIYGLCVREFASEADHNSRYIVDETIEVFRTALRRIAVLGGYRGPAEAG